MRRIVLGAASAVLFVMQLNNCDGGGSIPVSGIDSVSTGSTGSVNYCGCCDTCSMKYDLLFLDQSNVDSSFYWAALVTFYKDTVKGKIVKRHAIYPLQHTISVTAHYFDATPGQYYWVYVYKSSSRTSYDIIDANKAPSTVQTPFRWGHNCEERCCTGPTASKDRWYASAVEQVNGVVAVTCTLSTTFGAHLCGYGIGSVDVAFSNVHMNMSHAPSGPWAQVGLEHSRLRTRPTTTTDSVVFVEVFGDFLKVEYFVADPLGLEHKYECSVDPSTGTVTLYYDDVPSWTHSDSGWVGNTGTSVSCTGELYTRESDMPGTYSSPSIITNCEYKLSGGAFQSTNFAGPGSDDFQEWYITVDQNGTRVKIWDVNPLP